MRAWQVTGSFGLEHLESVELERERVGDHEVRIAVKAASLNFRDYLMVQGLYNPKQPLPLVPCSDGAGEVIEIGAKVTRVAVGDRVVGLFAQKWLSGRARIEKIRNTLGGPLPGMLREEAVLSEDGVAKFPAHYSYEEASTLPCAALTAWSALQQSELQSGETVLIQGTGGVALFAAQLAKLRGARVIITSKDDAKIARARTEVGIDEGINYKTTPAWSAPVRALTDKQGADVVIEVGGGGTMPESVRAVRAGGTIALIGVLAGVSTQVLLTPVLMQNVRIQGVLVGHRDAFDAMVVALSSSTIRPLIDRVYEFGQAREALEALPNGAHFGKLVVQVAS